MRGSQNVLYTIVATKEPNVCHTVPYSDSQVVLYRLNQPFQNFSGMLRILWSTQRPIGTHVCGVLIPPLFLALAALNPVGRIVREFLPVIRGAPLALAVFRTADNLIRAVARRLEGLLAVGALSNWHETLIPLSLPRASNSDSGARPAAGSFRRSKNASDLNNDIKRTGLR
jgi:hypothetical protein